MVNMSDSNGVSFRRNDRSHRKQWLRRYVLGPLQQTERQWIGPDVACCRKTVPDVNCSNPKSWFADGWQLRMADEAIWRWRGLVNAPAVNGLGRKENVSCCQNICWHKDISKTAGRDVRYGYTYRSSELSTPPLSLCGWRRKDGY